MKGKIVTKSFEQTQTFAQEFANSLKGGDILLLFGDLGAGKTTFMQGIAKGLGIIQPIISPTFVIMREYEILLSSRTSVRDLSDDNKISRQARNDITKLYHLDLYRIQSEDDLEGIGLSEILSDKNGVVAIEWSEKLGSLIPEKRIEIHLENVSESEREIEIQQIK